MHLCMHTSTAMYSTAMYLHIVNAFIRIYFLFFQSKGGILSKACDYITELKTANLRMSESLKETERLSVDLELLRQQCEELKSENSILRAQLQSHGLIPDIPGSNS